MCIHGSKKLYLYEPDPDWIPLYALKKDDEDGNPELTEYELTYDEYIKYMNVVSYAERLHERLERWKT